MVLLHRKWKEIALNNIYLKLKYLHKTRDTHFRNQIDQVLVDRRRNTCTTSLTAYKKTGCQPDQYLVVVKVRLSTVLDLLLNEDFSLFFFLISRCRANFRFIYIKIYYQHHDTECHKIKMMFSYTQHRTHHNKAVVSSHCMHYCKGLRLSNKRPFFFFNNDKYCQLRAVEI